MEALGDKKPPINHLLAADVLRRVAVFLVDNRETRRSNAQQLSLHAGFDELRDARPIDAELRAKWRGRLPPQFKRKSPSSSSSSCAPSATTPKKEICNYILVSRAFAEAFTGELYRDIDLSTLTPSKLSVLSKSLSSSSLASNVHFLSLRNLRGSVSPQIISILRSSAPHLLSLDLSGSHLRSLSPRTAPAILDAFPTNAPLKALNLSFADWDHSTQGGSTILKLIGERFQELECLNLQQSLSLKPAELSKLIFSLPNLHTISFGSSYLQFSAKSWRSFLKKAAEPNALGLKDDYTNELLKESWKVTRLWFDMESITDQDYGVFGGWELVVLIGAAFEVCVRS